MGITLYLILLSLSVCFIVMRIDCINIKSSLLDIDASKLLIVNKIDWDSEVK